MAHINQRQSKKYAPLQSGFDIELPRKNRCFLCWEVTTYTPQATGQTYVVLLLFNSSWELQQEMYQHSIKRFPPIVTTRGFWTTVVKRRKKQKINKLSLVFYVLWTRSWWIVQLCQPCSGWHTTQLRKKYWGTECWDKRFMELSVKITPTIQSPQMY